jgi:hypothetical protein
MLGFVGVVLLATEYVRTPATVLLLAIFGLSPFGRTGWAVVYSVISSEEHCSD